MPYFNVEDVDISPDEFLEKCSKKDLDETFNQLTENYGYGLDEGENEDDIRSEGHRIFIKNLLALKAAWYSIGKEDVQIIEVLAKKYGAL